MRAEVALCLFLIGSGCSVMQTFSRPEGNGGWSADRREEELARRAEEARVDVSATVPAAPRGQPLDLPGALALAQSGNRQIAEAERLVAMAAARVRETRGRLLPATVGTGRYSWYTDAQTNAVSLP